MTATEVNAEQIGELQARVSQLEGALNATATRGAEVLKELDTYLCRPNVITIIEWPEALSAVRQYLEAPALPSLLTVTQLQRLRVLAGEAESRLRSVPDECPRHGPANCIEIPQHELDRAAEAWAGGKIPLIDGGAVLD